jgi:hypothetical protein
MNESSGRLKLPTDNCSPYSDSIAKSVLTMHNVGMHNWNNIIHVVPVLRHLHKERLLSSRCRN